MGQGGCSGSDTGVVVWKPGRRRCSTATASSLDRLRIPTGGTGAVNTTRTTRPLACGLGWRRRVGVNPSVVDCPERLPGCSRVLHGVSRWPCSPILASAVRTPANGEEQSSGPFQGDKLGRADSPRAAARLKGAVGPRHPNLEAVMFALKTGCTAGERAKTAGSAKQGPAAVASWRPPLGNGPVRSPVVMILETDPAGRDSGIRPAAELQPFCRVFFSGGFCVAVWCCSSSRKSFHESAVAALLLLLGCRGSGRRGT
jgi:hypothetical protein